MIVCQPLSDLCLFLNYCCPFNTFICKWTWLWYLHVANCWWSDDCDVITSICMTLILIFLIFFLCVCAQAGHLLFCLVFSALAWQRLKMINANRFELLSITSWAIFSILPFRLSLPEDSVTAEREINAHAGSLKLFLISDWFCHLLAIMKLRTHFVFCWIEKIRQNIQNMFSV